MDQWYGVICPENTFLEMRGTGGPMDRKEEYLATSRSCCRARYVGPSLATIAKRRLTFSLGLSMWRG